LASIGETWVLTFLEDDARVLEELSAFVEEGILKHTSFIGTDDGAGVVANWCKGTNGGGCSRSPLRHEGEGGEDGREKGKVEHHVCAS
jgi:hypothetical protein